MTLTAASSGLDQQITDTFEALGLLIAVVAAYLAAMWPTAYGLIHADKPQSDDAGKTLAGRCTAHKYLSIGMTASAVAVLGVMAPLLWKVVKDVDMSSDFNPIRASIVLFAVFLTAGGVAGISLAVRLGSAAKKFRTPWSQS